VVTNKNSNNLSAVACDYDSKFYTNEILAPNFLGYKNSPHQLLVAFNNAD